MSEEGSKKESNRMKGDRRRKDKEEEYRGK